MKRIGVLPTLCLLIPALQSAIATVSLSNSPQRPGPGDSRKEIPLGTAVPDWRLKTSGGETVALSELRGNVVVLDFWANRCGLATNWSRCSINFHGSIKTNASVSSR